MQSAAVDRVIAEVDRARDEIMDFAAGLVRIRTVNPPGADYEACASVIGDQLRAHGADVHLLPALGRVEHTAEHPRINVVGRHDGVSNGPAVHLNGHFDVVPVGLGWTRDPFGGDVVDGRLYGRGSCDMKAGLAAAVFAAEAIRRSGIRSAAPIEISGTVDEESGGFASVGWLAEHRWISRERTKAVIIPEPFGVDRVCIGHRGVYWFEVIAEGRIAHGSMPYLGVNAFEGMSLFLDLIRDELNPALYQRVTAMPVVPDGSRHATININGIDGGQPARRELLLPTTQRIPQLARGFDRQRRDLGREAQHLLHCRRLTHDLPEIKLSRSFFSDLFNFASQVARFDGISNRNAEFFEVDGLGDEVVGAAAQS